MMKIILRHKTGECRENNTAQRHTTIKSVAFVLFFTLMIGTAFGRDSGIFLFQANEADVIVIAEVKSFAGDSMTIEVLRLLKGKVFKLNETLVVKGNNLNQAYVVNERYGILMLAKSKEEIYVNESEENGSGSNLGVLLGKMMDGLPTVVGKTINEMPVLLRFPVNLLGEKDMNIYEKIINIVTSRSIDQEQFESIWTSDNTFLRDTIFNLLYFHLPKNALKESVVSYIASVFLQELGKQNLRRKFGIIAFAGKFINDSTAKEILVKALSDGEVKARKNALMYLRRFENNDFEYSPENPTKQSLSAWAKWLEINRHRRYDKDNQDGTESKNDGANPVDIEHGLAVPNETVVDEPDKNDAKKENPKQENNGFNENPKPDTAENRLAEGLAAKDWTTIVAAVEELKARNLTPAALDAVCIRAERDAALNVLASGWLYRTTVFLAEDANAHIFVGGIAARVLLGDKESLAKLRDLAEFKSDRTMGDAASNVPPNKEMRELAEDKVDERRKDNAILFLTLLNDPGIETHVINALLEKKVSNRWDVIANTLVTAILVKDPQDGLRKMLALYDARIEQEHIFPLLAALQSLCRYKKLNRVSYYQADGPNQLEFAISEKLPKDLDAHLVKPYIALTNAFPTQVRPRDNIYTVLSALIGLIHQIPCNDDLLAAAEAFRNRISEDQYLKHFARGLDAFLKQQRNKNVPLQKNAPMEKSSAP